MIKTKNFIKKSLVFAAGLFVMAFGVALSVKANVGVSPVSCIPYVFSLKTALSLGELTIVFNALLMALQAILLRRNYRWVQLVQLPVVFLFGFFIDLSLHLISGLNAPAYAGQIGLCLISLIILAFGVFLEVIPNLTYLPGEGLIIAIVDTFELEFGKIKVAVDCAMVAGGIVSSYIFLHHLHGIREGTVLAALLVGLLVKLYTRLLPWLGKWLKKDVSQNSESELFGSAGNLVITISREYGSGGHEIGQLIASQLGIAFYDKQLIELTAVQSGFTADYIQQNEQKLAHTLLHELYVQNYAYVNDRLPPGDALFLVQSKIIREICRKEPCVIVGRCANFVLKNNPAAFNVFIHAGRDCRKVKIIKDYGAGSFLEKDLEHSDRQRANYCRKYTGENWRDAANYHMTIDSSLEAPEQIARSIVEIVREFTAWHSGVRRASL